MGLRVQLCQSRLKKIKALIGKEKSFKTLTVSCFSIKALLVSRPWKRTVFFVFQPNTRSILVVQEMISNIIHIRSITETGHIEFGFVAFPAEIICIFIQINALVATLTTTGLLLKFNHQTESEENGPLRDTHHVPYIIRQTLGDSLTVVGVK